MNRVNFNQSVSLIMGKTPQKLTSPVGARGRFTVQHIRDGKVIDDMEFHNDIVTEGKDLLLDVMFHAQTQAPTWWIGLIDDASYGSLNVADYYANINQDTNTTTNNEWFEFTLYDDPGNGDSTTTRPAWQEDAASGGSITNSTVSIFDITGTGIAKGVFVVGGAAAAQDKDDSTAVGGALWATALFGSGDVAVQNGDQLKVTYTVTA